MVVVKKHLLTWIYHSLKQSGGVAYESEVTAHITRVENDGGVVARKGVLNEWVMLLKNQGVFTGLQLSLSASYGYKLDGSSKVQTVYNLKGTTSAHDATQSDAAKRANFNATALNAKPGLVSTAWNVPQFYRGQLPAVVDQSNITVYVMCNSAHTWRDSIIGLTSSLTDLVPRTKFEVVLYRDVADKPLIIYRGNGTTAYERSTTDAAMNNEGPMVLMVRFKADGEWTVRNWDSISTTAGNWGYLESLTAQNNASHFIWSSTNGTDNQFVGTQFEAHVFNGFHNDTQANAILQWIRNRYFATETITDGGGGGGGSTGVTTPYPSTGGGSGTAKAIPDPNTVTYSDAPMVLTNAMRDGNGEIVITGKKIQSSNATVHCIDASQLSTRTKVIIRDCTFRQNGMAIWGGYTRHDWVVENNFFFGFKDMSNFNTYPDSKGWGNWAVRCNDPYSGRYEHNYIQDTGGFKLEFSAANASTCTGYQIRYNKAKNIFQPFYLMNFINIKGNNGANIPNQEIAWNECINTPGQHWVEDTINLYNASGTSTSRGRIHNNFLEGAMKNPWAENSVTPYTGGGIILDGTGTNPCDYWDMEDNIAIRQGNYCFAMALSRWSTMRRNKFCVSALFDPALGYGESYRIWTSGMWVDDYSSTGMATGNEIYDNTGGAKGLYQPRLDYFVADRAVGKVTLYNNTSIASPLTRDTEQLYKNEWYNRLVTNDIVLGPLEA